MERSKTNKEIYEQKYPLEKLSNSPMLCAEAIGYLKALIQYFPSEEKWATAKIDRIVAYIIFFSLD